MKTVLVAACMIVLQVDSVSAAELAGDITYGGTGCPAAGAGISARLNPKTGRMVIYTPDMYADLEASRMVRKACDIAVPLTVEANERLVIGRTSVFGKEQLALDHRLTTSAEAFVAGALGPKVQMVLDGAEDKLLRDFYNRTNDTLTTVCGQDVILRARNTLLAVRPVAAAGSVSQAQVKGLAFDIRVEQCESM